MSFFADDESSYARQEYAFPHERNLHKVHAGVCDGTTSHPPVVTDGDIAVMFEGQREALLDLIRKSHTVVGCVAWLTDMAILHALIGKQVCIIVQKEDFLRPDLDTLSIKEHNTNLRNAYDRLSGIDRYSLHVPFSVAGEPGVEPAILCAGLANSKKLKSWPRMHHKFLLFNWAGASDCGGAWGEEQQEEHGKIYPCNAVFTGSYNITKNAQVSFENSIIIQRQAIVDAYYKEFEHVFGISEPLDWNSEWVNPRYRVGT